MNGEKRRDRLLEILDRQQGPVSGAELSAQLGVSRQVIVQDIALLRAAGQEILSTTKGYVYGKPMQRTKVLKVSHTDEQMEEELNTVVDLGGTVIDVFVKHKVYGEIRAELNLRSRRDVTGFMERIKSGASQPLKHITSDFHYHTISAESEEVLALIEETLREKGFLLERQRMTSAYQ